MNTHLLRLVFRTNTYSRDESLAGCRRWEDGPSTECTLNALSGVARTNRAILNGSSLPYLLGLFYLIPSENFTVILDFLSLPSGEEPFFFQEKFIYPSTYLSIIHFFTYLFIECPKLMHHKRS